MSSHSTLLFRYALDLKEVAQGRQKGTVHVTLETVHNMQPTLGRNNAQSMIGLHLKENGILGFLT